jgi:hypothetical protein
MLAVGYFAALACSSRDGIDGALQEDLESDAVEAESGPHEDVVATDEAESDSPDEVESVDKAGCSHVQFCNHPDPNLGSVCIQDGCFDDPARADAECRDDIVFVCGRITPPAFINDRGTLFPI